MVESRAFGTNLAEGVPEETEVGQMVGLHHRSWARMGGPGGADLAEQAELGRHHAVEKLEQPIAGERLKAGKNKMAAKTSTQHDVGQF